MPETDRHTLNKREPMKATQKFLAAVVCACLSLSCANNTSPEGGKSPPKPSEYTHAWNGKSAWDGTSPVQGVPAAAHRGGGSSEGTRDGVFAFAVDLSPGCLNASNLGFRCIVPR
jgi:hypothetical protein